MKCKGRWKNIESRKQQDVPRLLLLPIQSRKERVTQRQKKAEALEEQDMDLELSKKSSSGVNCLYLIATPKLCIC